MGLSFIDWLRSKIPKPISPMPVPVIGFTPPDQRNLMSLPIDAAIPYTPKLRVDELYVGNGLLIRWQQGTHRKDGRLSVEGVGDNGIEIQLVPGPECKTGIAAQVMIFFHRLVGSWARFSLSARKQSDGSPIFSIGPDSSNRATPPIEFLTGGRTFADGTDNGGRLLALVFEDGQIDRVEPDGSRVVIRRPGGVPADPRP